MAAAHKVQLRGRNVERLEQRRDYGAVVATVILCHAHKSARDSRDPFLELDPRALHVVEEGMEVGEENGHLCSVHVISLRMSHVTSNRRVSSPSHQP